MLIYDIGFHQGEDTAFYLSKGHTVVAVEANPTLVEAGKRRFAKEIADGRLTLLNFAVWSEGGKTMALQLYNDTGQSSLLEGRKTTSTPQGTVEVQCITLPQLFASYSVPGYLKIDIEGADEVAVRSLESSQLPKYLSYEIACGSDSYRHLKDVGYRHFKVINQETFTSSLPIFRQDWFPRILRKISTMSPSIKTWIASSSFRPKRIYWDTFRERYPYAFGHGGSSGPLPSETEGLWLTFNQIEGKLRYLYGAFEREGLTERFWFDLHAKRDEN